MKSIARLGSLHGGQSPYAAERASAMRGKLERGETIYLVGIGLSGHNTGAALVECSSEGGVRLLHNNEEERFRGIKHCAEFPEMALDVLGAQMARLGLGVKDVHAYLATWDYVTAASNLLRHVAEEAPASLSLLRASASPNFNVRHIVQSFLGPAKLGAKLGLGKAHPIIALRHHDNHAYFSYGVSPFAGSQAPVMILVADGFGDDGAISLYVARGNSVRRIGHNQNIFDSVGLFYSIISSTQGGWTTLSSEGRYMGAAAWGDNERETNPYYRPLRRIFKLDGAGRFYLNRALSNWHVKGELKPYKAALSDILGPAITPRQRWNPDLVLDVERIENSEVTRERADKAAAAQMVFEDVVFHVVEHLILATGSAKLVFTGGAALNCLLNMRLLERFGEPFYRRHFGRTGDGLRLWVPPTPGDAGATMGAAYNFALSNGATVGEPLRHAFYCGLPAAGDEILATLEGSPEIAYLPLGNINDPSRRKSVANLLARIVAEDGVVGLFQGVAETGPRALGHRSILANPCNPRTRELLNRKVKFREKVRPLAPMVTRRAAQQLFELSPGAADDDYNAYNYMVVTARARPLARRLVPAVVHLDGTVRLAIVREEIDPFVHSYLVALGERTGAEVSVNTSLNVAGPIAQTPAQAVNTLKRSGGLDGLFFVGAEGDVFLAWHNVSAPPKDEGVRLRRWLRAWEAECRVEVC
jgi:carbamoyltransferase